MLASSYGAHVIRDGMRAILAASTVMMLISLIGTALACCPPSRARGVAMGAYLCCGLPSLVFLIFVSVSALALRDKADNLVTQYWSCLKAVSPNPDKYSQQLPDAYQHVEAAASCCIASAVTLLVGMLAACRVIGWHVVARNAVMAISMATSIIGFGILVAGVILKLTSSLATVYFDVSLIAFGAIVLIVSLIGVVGSKRESRCMLNVYAMVLGGLELVLLGGITTLLFVGTGAVEAWMDENWESVSSSIYLMNRDEFHSMLNRNVLSIITLGVLLILVLALDLFMTLVLGYSVKRHGKLFQENEMESLVGSYS